MNETGQVFIDLRLKNILIKFTNEKKNDYIVKLKLTDDTGLTKQFQNLDKSQEDNEHIHTDAPEILNKEDFNEKSDLWSLGVIIYFLYFKEYPYEGKSSSEILAQIKKGQSKLKKSGNSDLDDLIRGLLKEKPENRIDWMQYFTHQFFNKKNDASKNYTDLYEIKAQIGHTDYATIFKAKDKESGELKAIKVFDFNSVKNYFLLEYGRGPTEEELKAYKDNFINEFELMKIIKGENNENNNIVKVYESYTNQNEFAVIMELCDDNLLHIWDKSKSFSSNEIGDVLSQLNNSFKIMNEKKLQYILYNYLYYLIY
jgi:serine/threonine-protein kinase ULK/ATG1